MIKARERERKRENMLQKKGRNVCVFERMREKREEERAREGREMSNCLKMMDFLHVDNMARTVGEKES